MKLKKLELISTRGIIYETLEPNCQNMGIYGSNGQGKSAVIDGLDFLLTGTISRLTGEGGRDLSLKRHGPNITTDKPEHAKVKGVFVLKNGEEVSIERNFADPDNPSIIGSADATKLANDALQVATMGQHVLTRREILQFITATGNDRATKIQSLLKLQQTEKLRTILKNIQNTNEKNEHAKKAILNTEIGKLQALIGIIDEKNFEKNILDFVNQKRGILHSDSLMSLKSVGIFKNLKPITHVDSGEEVSPTQYVSALTILSNFYQSKTIPEIEEEIEFLFEYRKSVDIATADLEKQIKMIDLAVELIFEGRCPLCELEWDMDKLKSMLEEKKRKLNDLNNEYKNYLVKKVLVQGTISPIISSLDTLVKGLNLPKDDLLSIWSLDLNTLSESIEKPLSGAVKQPATKTNIFGNFLLPNDIGKRLVNLGKYLEEKYPKTTPEQDAWDTLTKLQTLLSGLESAEEVWKEASLVNKRTQDIYTEFIKSRDEVVQDIYDSINSEFISYYKILNGDDEGSFNSKLTSNGPGLDFEVDFYGYGVHPPHALHSEGHQDSMGICVFLALSKKFNGNALDIIMLDDVVMSIDSGHREKFAELIKDKFSDKQFIITTHEKVWSEQLIRKKVTSYNVEFSGWDPTKGPNTSISKDWKGGLEDLVDALKKGLDHNSIGSFRKIIEEQFLRICIDLDVKTNIRLDGNYTLGDLLPPAIKKFREVVDESSEQTSGKVRSKEDYEKMLTAFDECREKITEKGWMINPATHYTDWENFTPNEKAELISLYATLLDMYFCPVCSLGYHVNPSEKILLCKCNN